jgi:hypothetical protein
MGSFLVETPGQLASGMFFMERRVLAQYVLASTVIDYTAQYPQLVLNTVHASREKMTKTSAIYDENNLIVLEHGKSVTGTWATPLVDPITGETINADHTVDYAEHTIALKARPRATAYVIPKGLEHEEEILRLANNHAIGYYELHPKSVVNLRQYAQSNGEVELSKEREVCFENGAYVFPNTVPSTILGVIMEPDFGSASGRKMTLLSMGLVDADENGCLPVFRYCHDLKEGKVAVEPTDSAAFESSYIDKVTKETYESMKNALGRIDARVKGE